MYAEEKYKLDDRIMQKYNGMRNIEILMAIVNTENKNRKSTRFNNFVL